MGTCYVRIVGCARHFRHISMIALPDVPALEFRSYLADLPRLQEAEAASCESLVTECEVRDVLKHIGLNKLPGRDGLPYEMCLKMSHMFVPILEDMFNHRFDQSLMVRILLITFPALYKYPHGGHTFGICNIAMGWVCIAWPSPMHNQLLFFGIILGVLKFILYVFVSIVSLLF